MKKCHFCRISKQYSKFGINRSTRDGFQASCNECRKIIRKNWYEKHKKHHGPIARTWSLKRLRVMQEIVYNHLLSHPCIDCNEKDIVVLQFDHVRGKKYKCISTLVKNGNIQKLKKEMEKCDIRCANCHARKTAKETNSFKISLCNSTDRVSHS